MPLIQTVILISLLQLATYALLDKFKLGKLKYLVLAILFTLYLFVLPPYYFPPGSEAEPRCGLPDLAITLGVWFIGGIATVIAHTLYLLLLKKLVVRQEGK